MSVLILTAKSDTERECDIAKKFVLDRFAAPNKWQADGLSSKDVLLSSQEFFCFFPRAGGWPEWQARMVKKHDIFVCLTERIGKGNAGIVFDALGKKKTVLLLLWGSDLVPVVDIACENPSDWAGGWRLILGEDGALEESDTEKSDLADI